jgi:hypothetical protein
MKQTNVTTPLRLLQDERAVLKFYETIDFLLAEIDGTATESTVAMPNERAGAFLN